MLFVACEFCRPVTCCGRWVGDGTQLPWWLIWEKCVNLLVITDVNKASRRLDARRARRIFSVIPFFYFPVFAVGWWEDLWLWEIGWTGEMESHINSWLCAAVLVRYCLSTLSEHYWLCYSMMVIKKSRKVGRVYLSQDYLHIDFHIINMTTTQHDTDMKLFLLLLSPLLFIALLFMTNIK